MNVAAADDDDYEFHEPFSDVHSSKRFRKEHFIMLKVCKDTEEIKKNIRDFTFYCKKKGGGGGLWKTASKLP